MIGKVAKNNPWSVYILRDPRDMQIKYVGVTTKSVERRLSEHIYRAKMPGSNTRNYKWINKLTTIGLRPLIEVIETGRGDLWKDAEIGWISFYRSIGSDLNNLTDGGEGTPGRVMSDDAKSKLRDRAKAKFLDQEFVKKFRAAKAASDSHRREESARRKEIKKLTPRQKKKLSEQHKNNISKGLIGRPVSDDTKEKIRQKRLGFKFSEESKNKMSKSHIGKNNGLEAIQKTKIANTGKKRSQEIRESLRESQKIAKSIELDRKISRGEAFKCLKCGSVWAPRSSAPRRCTIHPCSSNNIVKANVGDKPSSYSLEFREKRRSEYFKKFPNGRNASPQIQRSKNPACC